MYDFILLPLIRLGVAMSIAVLVMCFGDAFGQRNSIDSLRNVAKAGAKDTTHVNTLVLLSREMYRSGGHAEEVKFARAALKLSQRLRYAKGEGDSRMILGHIKMRNGDYDSASHHFDRAQSLFKAAKNYRSLANIHLFKGQVSDYRGNYSHALKQYSIASSLIDLHPDSTIKFKILNSTGITHLNKGNYETALQFYLQALKVAETFDDKLYYASVLNNIGAVHMTIFQYDEALEYFLRYLKTMSDLKHTRFTAVALLNVGEAYRKKGECSKGIVYLDSALATYASVAEKRGMSLSHSNLAECYKDLGDYNNAVVHFNKAISIGREIKSDDALLKGLVGIAELYIRGGIPENATPHLQDAYRVAKAIGSMPYLEKTCLLNSRLDSARGDYRSAYQWYKSYSALNDSLFNERKSQQVLQMRELYETEKKDKEIKLLSEAKKLEELKSNSNQKLLWMSIVFFLTIIVGILWWVSVKSRHSSLLKNRNERLSDAYKKLSSLMGKVEDQNKLLAQKNEALEEMHREKDGLIGIVAHDLRAPLNRVSGLTRLLIANKELTNEDKEIVAIIEKVCQDGNGLIRDLLELNMTETHETFSSSTIELSRHIQALLSQYKEALNRKDLKVFLEYESPLTITTNASYLDRILDNIITNAIKFSPAGRNVYVKIINEANSARIVIEDQGQGFHPDDLPFIFRKFKKLSARPTAGESSTGLGLSIVKSLTEKIGVTVEVKSVWGRGATFIINLPFQAENGRFHSSVSGHVAA